MELSEQDWAIRLSVYRFFVDQGRPPTAAETARRFDLSDEAVRAAYRRLHEGHALYVDPESDEIRMANPLSAVPTPHQVQVGERRYYANCAWDSLGIPAMLHSDARIETRDSYTGDPVSYAIEHGQLKAAGGLVHFPLPFRDWYEDQVHT